MAQLCAFAEMGLERNSFETLCEILAAMSDEDLEKLLNS